MQIPSNFSGTKFAVKYNLALDDFYVVEGVLHSPIADPDLSDCIVTQEEWDAIQQSMVDRQTIKDAYQTMIGRLEQIQNANNPTNAQIVQAIKDEALYIERIMKVLKISLT